MRSRLVGEEAGSRAGDGVEARENDGGGGQRKPILDRKTKKEERRSKATGAREKTPIKGSGEKTLGQPIHRTGGRTLGTGGAAPAEIMEIDLPGGGAVRKRRRLGLDRLV